MNRFYKYLYWGAKAAEDKKTIKHYIRFKKFLPGIYIIVLSQFQDQLEIYDMFQLFQPSMKKFDFFIVGVAHGKTEAYQVVQTIVEDTVAHTNGANVKQYILDQSHIK